MLISKHAGVNFHKGAAAEGLVSKIRNDLHCDELYPLHRLDTVTSGLILFARNRISVSKLASQFREHRINKFYLALAGTHPLKKQGMVRGDMIKGRNGTWFLARSMDNPAVTQFLSTGLGNGLRLYILKPRTGKTHQLRVALKSLGVPILGDPLYYRKKDNSHPVDRAYLHAYALGFELDGKRYRFVYPPDEGVHFQSEEFRVGLERFADPWSLDWPGRK